MSKRIEIVSSSYDDIDEESRLSRSRHGQLEYATTMELFIVMRDREQEY